ncbi:tyrosine protein phosphatase PTP3 KNAG_0L01690 [Huiozyma naganishii CBS 8797]|uniref:protein-tyrosine-phosphatase n=1 Tax=Huiozyma naganishii (strain ATCC MYA-139 / BCRC 22969 / CBS 8797 / KCTC 17520 / NBRC 10181 / NCYC 3082 / Yp74L-3) TaxID=1071383 RepID=J7SAJ0_HUIN7|nr:hypothetical protein KNAG_0L01690 [Kazachstania naganishii CBS 8797]CCK72789.1 hypothetical protein KNAG_0L01690 [Kazachstania naganishii CBS 8797]
MLECVDMQYGNNTPVQPGQTLNVDTSVSRSSIKGSNSPLSTETNMRQDVTSNGSYNPFTSGHGQPYILKRAATTPLCVPSFKPNETKFPNPHNSTLISSIELGKILSHSDSAKNLLIFDTRPFTERSKEYIAGSLHICLPSTLLRRKNFTLDKLIESLPLNEQKIINGKLESPNLQIILYDGTTNQTDSSISLAIYGIAQKFLDHKAFEARIHSAPSENIILILASGYHQFSTLFPELVVKYADQYSPQEKTAPNSAGLSIPRMSTPVRALGDYSTLTPPTVTPAMDQNSLSNSSGHSNCSTTAPDAASSVSSSPISALFKFQLPTSHTSPSPLFKFAQTEEIMDLESYLSVVNINEESKRINAYTGNPENNFLLQESSPPSINNFQFPKRNSLPTSNNQDKLNVQLKFYELVQVYPENEVNMHIPHWFRNLMQRAKIQFIAQYQKLDILEKKRLNSSISSYNSDFGSTAGHKKTMSEMGPSPFMVDGGSGKTETGATKFSEKRANSQPDINLKDSKRYWLRNLEEEDNDEEISNSKLFISSGVELGNKNRYKDIFPYEHSRVRLRKTLQDDETDITVKTNPLESTVDISDNYINANYLGLPDLELTEQSQGASHIGDNFVRVRYVATQAPMMSTVHDFYTCILNDDIPVIISLTNSVENGIEKCFKYWQEKNYDGIQVKLKGESQISANIIIRIIELTQIDTGSTYETLQMQLINWPDLGIAENPVDIVQLIILKNIIMGRITDKLDTTPIKSTPTVLVHCSAGCGRTGTWCTVDSILSNLPTFNILQNHYPATGSSTYDPISWTINIFRKQRISMVQNINQFLFIYDCLLYYFKLNMNDNLKDQNVAFPMKQGESLTHLQEKISHIPIVEKFLSKKNGGTGTTCYKVDLIYHQHICHANN